MVKKQQDGVSPTLLYYSDSKEIPASLAKKLRDLTLRDAGEMQGRFADNRNRWYGYKSKVVVAMVADQVIGWVMLSFFVSSKVDAELMTYVRKSFRRKGVGSMLVKSICKMVSRKSTIGVYYTADYCTSENIFYMEKIADPRFRQL